MSCSELAEIIEVLLEHHRVYCSQEDRGDCDYVIRLMRAAVKEEEEDG